MSGTNDTKIPSAVFLLTGIPGLENIYLWIFITFCIMYTISIAGNTLILFVIKTDLKLHEPMYIFLSMLTLTDIGLLISTMPTTLGVFFFNSREISLDACFAQMFFVHLFSYSESSMLLLMAFDRFMAICNPLRYVSILTLPRIAKMGLVFVLRSVALLFPLPFLVKRFQYCQCNVLSHSFCLHPDIMKLACADITVNIFYGLAIKILTVGLDSLLILISYVMILKAVLSVASSTQCFTALNTCVSHLRAVLLFYVPNIGLSVVHRFGNSSSHWLQSLMGYIYMLVPPLMNPIVYSVKSKHLRSRMLEMFFK